MQGHIFKVWLVQFSQLCLINDEGLFMWWNHSIKRSRKIKQNLIGYQWEARGYDLCLWLIFGKLSRSFVGSYFTFLHLMRDSWYWSEPKHDSNIIWNLMLMPPAIAIWIQIKFSGVLSFLLEFQSGQIFTGMALTNNVSVVFSHHNNYLALAAPHLLTPDRQTCLASILSPPPSLHSMYSLHHLCSRT